jgi:hypothetical protein
LGPTVQVELRLGRQVIKRRSLLFLGLLWLPGLECLPRLTPHQRYLTLARFLSIPCVLDVIKAEELTPESEAAIDRSPRAIHVYLSAEISRNQQ